MHINLNNNQQPQQPKSSLPETLASKISGTSTDANHLSGSGSAFVPSTQSQTPTNPTIKNKSQKKKTPLIVAALLVLLLVVSGFFYLQEITKEVEVPTVPVSEPKADDEYPCSLYFANFYTCSEQGCENNDDCLGNDVCIWAVDGNHYCSLPGNEYRRACAANPSYESCCLQADITGTPTPTPTPTDEPEELLCGDPGCFYDDDCEGELVCTRQEASVSTGYCSEPPYVNACRANPSYESCCEEQMTPTPTGTLTPTPTGTLTPTPTATPTSTPPPDATATPTLPPGATATQVPPTATTVPQVVVTQPPYVTPLPTVPGQPPRYIVDTKAECNDVCETNADCNNISHICYHGRCRLDINPEDEFCRTPAGETYVERIVEAPVSGPREWLNFLKVGIGALAAGLLILLLL